MFRRQIFRLQSTSVRQVRWQSTESAASTRKLSSDLSLIISSFVLGGLTAQFLPLSEISKFAIKEKIPDPNTPEADDYKLKLENKLHALPIVKHLNKDPNFEAVRAWNYVDSNTKAQSVSSGTLSVPGGIAIKPILFYNKLNNESISVVHLGDKLCGYPFLVHGGVLATILDEILKRGSSLRFGIDPISEYKPEKIKTKHIELQYKFPTLANNFIVIKTREVDGKIEGRIETPKGRLLVKGLGEFESRSSPPQPPSDSTTKKRSWFF